MQRDRDDPGISRETKVVTGDELVQKGRERAPQRSLVLEFELVQDLPRRPFVTRDGPAFVKMRRVGPARRAQAFFAHRIEMPRAADTKGRRVPGEARAAGGTERVTGGGRMPGPAQHAVARENNIDQACPDAVDHGRII